MVTLASDRRLDVATGRMKATLNEMLSEEVMQDMTRRVAMFNPVEKEATTHCRNLLFMLVNQIAYVATMYLQAFLFETVSEIHCATIMLSSVHSVYFAEMPVEGFGPQHLRLLSVDEFGECFKNAQACRVSPMTSTRMLTAKWISDGQDVIDKRAKDTLMQALQQDSCQALVQGLGRALVEEDGERFSFKGAMDEEAMKQLRQYLSEAIATREKEVSRPTKKQKKAAAMEMSNSDDFYTQFMAEATSCVVLPRKEVKKLLLESLQSRSQRFLNMQHMLDQFHRNVVNMFAAMTESSILQQLKDDKIRLLFEIASKRYKNPDGSNVTVDMNVVNNMPVTGSGIQIVTMYQTRFRYNIPKPIRPALESGGRRKSRKD